MYLRSLLLGKFKEYSLTHLLTHHKFIHTFTHSHTYERQIIHFVKVSTTLVEFSLSSSSPKITASTPLRVD